VAQVLDIIGRLIVRYLERPVQGYDPFTPSDPVALRKTLEPGDVLLVEGNSHISRVIKYLTQSTWSHAALYVGPVEGAMRAISARFLSVRLEASRPRRHIGPAFEILPASYAHLPADRTEPGGPQDHLQLCHRAHRVRLRPQEHH
jgi:hypothetical protein